MIFKKSSPQRIGAMISELESDLGNERRQIEEANRAIGEATLAIKDGVPGAKESLAKARLSLERSIAKEHELTNALAMARERYSVELDSEHRSNIERKWEAVEVLIKRRSVLADSIVSKTKALIHDLKDFKSIGAEIYEIAPSKDLALGQSNLGPGVIDNHFRFLLLSLGCAWANSWPFGDLTIPKFVEQSDEGHRWILAQKTRAADSAAKTKAVTN